MIKTNYIINGDTIEEMKKLKEKSIDLILCDLPYGTTRNKWDIVIPFEILWKEYNRIIKPNGVIVLTGHELFTAKIILSNEKDFKYKLVWVKSKATNFLNAKKQPLRKHEDICIFYKKKPTYNPQKIPGVPYNRGIRKNSQSNNYNSFNEEYEVKNEKGDRYPTDVIYFKTAETEGKVIHPTQKPIELGRYLIRTYTNEGDIVLDNCSGSGSFLIAAIKEKRKYIGIEKEEKYFKESLKRIEKINR